MDIDLEDQKMQKYLADEFTPKKHSHSSWIWTSPALLMKFQHRNDGSRSRRLAAVDALSKSGVEYEKYAMPAVTPPMPIPAGGWLGHFLGLSAAGLHPMDVKPDYRFVWRKKIERDVSQGQKVDISVKSEKRRQQERMAEIEKVKKRREERAIEKAQHEEEMQLLARERARAEFQAWEKEEEFHFDESKVRSDIRLREGRTKPIDVLLKNLSFSDEFDVELNEPYLVFKGLTVKEMEELRDDIKMHLDLDRESQTNVKYWECLDKTTTTSAT